MDRLNLCIKPSKKGVLSHSYWAITKIVIILLILQSASLLADCMQYEGGKSYTISGPLPPEGQSYSYLSR